MKRLATKSLIAVFVLWVQTVAFAAVCFGETGTGGPGSSLLDSRDPLVSDSTSGGTLWMIVKVIFFLLFIIGIFFVIMKLISQKNKYTSGRSIRSLGGLPLGQNKSIQIVEIGKSLYVVGVGDNVQLLEKIEDETEIEYIAERMTIGPSLQAPVFQSVGGWLQKLKPKRQTEEEMDVTDVTTSFQQVFQDKMQHVTDRKKWMEDMLKQDQSNDGSNDK